MPVDPLVSLSPAEYIARVIRDAEDRLLAKLRWQLTGQRRDGVLISEQNLFDLQRMQFWDSTVRREIRRLQRDLGPWVAQQVAEVWKRAEIAARGDLAEGGIRYIIPAGRETAMILLAQEMTWRLYPLTERMLRAWSDAYRELQGVLVGNMIVGNTTRREAAQHMLNEFAKRGITGFRDKAGRSWEPASYAEMALRTGFNNVTRQAYMQTLGASGWDLVIVSTAPHPCPLCAKWEGKVLRIDDTRGVHTVRAPSALDASRNVEVRVQGSVAEATEDGLHHPNCRHGLSLYQPGVHYDFHPKTDPEEYQAVQRQRALERQLRTWKRRRLVAFDAREEARAKRAISKLNRKMREHLQNNPFLHRKRQRERVRRAH